MRAIRRQAEVKEQFPSLSRLPNAWSFIACGVATPKMAPCFATLKRCEQCGKAQGEHAEAKHDFKLDENFPKWRGWHAARRGLGSNLYALGVPEKVIQQILRHANVATTNTYYIKTASDQVTSAMEKLQQALPESLSGSEVATQSWNAAATTAVN
jgi:hypothetical protein